MAVKIDELATRRTEPTPSGGASDSQSDAGRPMDQANAAAAKLKLFI
jgi:hypothetical protein